MKKYCRTAAVMAAVIISVNTSALCASAEFVTENGSTYYLDEGGNKVPGLEEIDGKKPRISARYPSPYIR
ncbi:MAG: hypothetical protein MR038_04030 [Oscillospiraceae bacterium]|nr:hypothetical protein [Oscillospiraceae bacterium]